MSDKNEDTKIVLPDVSEIESPSSDEGFDVSKLQPTSVGASEAAMAKLGSLKVGDFSHLANVSESVTSATEAIRRQLEMNDAAAAVRASANISDSVEAVLRKSGLNNLEDAHLRATSAIRSLERTHSHILKNQNDNVMSDDFSPIPSPPRPYSDQRTEKFQDDLIGAINLQNEQTSEVIALQIQLRDEGRESSKWAKISAGCAGLAAITPFLLLYLQQDPSMLPSEEIVIESQEPAGAELEPPQPISSLEEGSPLKDQVEPVQPQQSPTAVRDPADSAESSSDQHEP